MAEKDAFWQAGGACGVKSRRPRILVEIGEIEIGRARQQQHLVFTFKRNGGRLGVRRVGYQHEFLDRLDTVLEAFDDRQEFGIDQESFGAGVIQSVEETARD